MMPINLLPFHLVVVVISYLIVAFAVPSIIRVSHIKHLFDEPTEGRKIHKINTPNLGGVAIFAGFIFSVTVTIHYSLLTYVNYILAAAMILFVIGLKDDLVGISPNKKLIAQIISAFILAYMADIRIEGFHGIFGLKELPYWVSVVFTTFTIIVIMNAFNLIDGIDGLAGAVGVVVCACYAILFYLMGHFGLSLLACALLGSIIGFLKYNISPAQVFMGDTGSLLIGMVSAVLTIKFVELNRTAYVDVLKDFFLKASPAIAFSILIIPLFDLLRVFVLRIIKGHSPFKADRNHLHHKLIDKGYSHSKAVVILVLVNILFIIFALSLRRLGSDYLLISVVALAVLLNVTLLSQNNK